MQHLYYKPGEQEPETCVVVHLRGPEANGILVDAPNIEMLTPDESPRTSEADATIIGAIGARATRVRSQTTIRPSVHLPSRMSRGVSNDQHEQPAATRLRGMFGRDSPQSNRDDATRGRVAHLDNDAAWTRAVHRSGELAVETQHDGDAVIVVLAGEFDLATAESVRDALTRAMGEARRRLIIDLGAVTFIDSSGLHAILDAYKVCRDVAPTLTIRPGPPNVQQVFESTNLLDRLPFEISE